MTKFEALIFTVVTIVFLAGCITAIAYIPPVYVINVLAAIFLIFAVWFVGLFIYDCIVGECND